MAGTGGVCETGEVFDPNECAFPDVRPTNEDVIELRLERSTASKATLISPELETDVALDVRRDGGGVAVELPAGALKRYAEVVLE